MADEMQPQPDQPQPDQPQGADAGGPLPEVDEATAKKLAKNDEAIARIVNLAIATLDPRDMLKKYAKLGKAAADHAIWQKAQFPSWGAEDFDRLCDQIADRVKMQVAIQSVRISTYVRVHFWLEAVKPMVPDADKLSYYQVVNHFLPTLSFNPVDLAGKIKDGWVDVVRDLVAQQIGDNPLPIKELKAILQDHADAMAAERDAQKGPEKLAEENRKKSVRKATREENKLREQITMGIDSALGGTLEPESVVGILQKVAADRGVTLPKVGVDPHAMAPKQVPQFVAALKARGDVALVRALRDQLDALIAELETPATTGDLQAERTAA